MLKDFFEDYDYETNRPQESDFIDFTRVTGPEIYHFVSPYDTDCTPETAATLAS